MSKGQVADPTVPLPETFSHLKDRGYKAINYGGTINIRGPGCSTRIMDEIIGKQRSNQSVVIVVTGPPGIGKTLLALRWAQKLDPNFHVMDTPPPPPTEDHGQCTFERKHIQHLIGSKTPLHRGQVIVMDEFHFGGGNRDWQAKEQKKFVKLIAAIRSKGFVLVIVVLHAKMIDKMIRDFVLNYEFAVKAHGYAIAYRRWFPVKGNEPWRKRLGPMYMQMPDQSLCNYGDCFKCGYLHASEKRRCETLRAIYERRKEWFLDEQSDEDEEEERKSEYMEFNAAIVKILTMKDLIPRKNSGAIHKGRFEGWLKENEIKIRKRDMPIFTEKLLTTLGEKV